MNYVRENLGWHFFLKTAHKGRKIRAVHLTVTVDGTNEKSTKRKWDQKTQI